MHQVCCVSDDVARAETDACLLYVKSDGAHGRHALASQDIKAGSVVVQCLPIAHSFLITPGKLLIDDGDEDDYGKPRRCVRCFFKEGNNASTDEGRRKKFGRCSRCKVAYYCSRSCQVNSISQHVVDLRFLCFDLLTHLTLKSQAEDWIQQHKLECQYYVKRRKQSVLYAGSAEEDAIPLLLRTFASLKYQQSDAGRKEGAESDCQIFNCNSTDSNREHKDAKDKLISCGRTHFSFLAVSAEFQNPEFMMPNELANNNAAMRLAKELMVSSVSAQNQHAAALDVFGYNARNEDASDVTKQYNLDQATQRALNAFLKNNFGIVDSLHSPIGEGIYPCAALLNHSCHPNCILRYEFGRSRATNTTAQQYHQPILQIIACRDVLKGEELTHSYVDLALSTEERRLRLSQAHGFDCDCKRCGNDCYLELPKIERDWDRWPLRRNIEDKEEKHPELVRVYLDHAMTFCIGNDQYRVIRQSRLLHQRANQCMVEGDGEGELDNLLQATKLMEAAGFSPFHFHLYSIRCSYLTALLANERIEEAVEQCEHIVSFLAVAFSHVQNHPLLGLQLYTLGDLYSAMSDLSEQQCTKDVFKTKAKLTYTSAKDVLQITHGRDNEMVIALCDNLANI